MKLDDFEDIEIKDLFKISREQRVSLIEAGVDSIIENCQKTSIFTGVKTSKLLSDTLGRLEFKVQELASEEEYELSYYINELIWGVHRKLAEIQKNKEE